jgi:proteic killer suppression protein
VEFADRGTEDIYDGLDTKRARRTLPAKLHAAAADLLDVLAAAQSLRDLASPGAHLEKLSRDRAGQHSVRINDQYRICFVWTKDGPADIEIVDYH